MQSPFVSHTRTSRWHATWQEAHSERLYKQQLIGRTLQTLVMHETARAFRSWQSWFESRVHAAQILNQVSVSEPFSRLLPSSLTPSQAFPRLLTPSHAFSSTRRRGGWSTSRSSGCGLCGWSKRRRARKQMSGVEKQGFQPATYDLSLT